MKGRSRGVSGKEGWSVGAEGSVGRSRLRGVSGEEGWSVGAEGSVGRRDGG